MLDQNDIKQIGTVIDERLQKAESRIDDRFKKAEDRIIERTTIAVVTQVGEFIEQNILPAIDTLIEEKLTDKLRPLPDRDFITRQTSEVKGTIVAQLRKEDEKVNLLIKFLKEKNILNDDQQKALRELQVFPSIEI